MIGTATNLIVDTADSCDRALFALNCSRLHRWPTHVRGSADRHRDRHALVSGRHPCARLALASPALEQLNPNPSELNKHDEVVAGQSHHGRGRTGLSSSDEP